MSNFSRTLTSLWRWLFAATLIMAGAAPALAAAPVGVSVSEKICNLATGETLPDAGGNFICALKDYSGNAGKNWNELDLVPLRITLDAGNSAPAIQTFTLATTLDYLDGGKPGYDVLSAPVLNAALSSASCQAADSSAQAVLTPGIGGTDSSLYRLVTFTQAKNTSCVYDYYGRLALGSHLYPGSSLHANLMTENFTTGGIGAQDRSIPVNQISPQEISKDMTATQDLDHAWNIEKSPMPANLSFGDVCRADAPSTLPVQITVKWTRTATVPGVITVTTHVYAKNPASRTITTTVTDKIYSGTTLLDTVSGAPVDVPANTQMLVLTHTTTVPAGTTSLNDVATASYIDKVTSIPIPGTTTATASASVQTGVELNATAAVSDLESMTGNALTFSVATPAIGGFLPYPTASDPAYLAGSQTVGPVSWGATGQGSGSVTFDKTVYLAGKTSTSGILSDVATVAGTVILAQSPVVDIKITSTATVSFTLTKTIPLSLTLAAGESIQVKFTITGPSGPIAKTLTFGAGEHTKSVPVSGLEPGLYTVHEDSAIFFDAANPAGIDSHLTAVGGDKTIDLSIGPKGQVTCTGEVKIDNARSGTPPSAQVKKITVPVIGSGDPDYLWSFTLTGPGTPALTETKPAGANAGYVPFAASLTEPGLYTVTETQKAPAWVLTSATPSGVPATVCSFTLTNADIINGVLKSCTFVNTKQGKANVVKTVSGAAPSGTQSFTFQLRQGASPTSDGTTLDTKVANAANVGTVAFSPYLVPGSTYQICESGMLPGWSTTLGTFVPNSYLANGVTPNPSVDNSVKCENFSVGAGETKTFTVNNVPPPFGDARTIGYWKNWASCKTSGGKQAPVLDRTMAKAEPVGIQVDGFFLHGSTATPDHAPDCAKAVSLLNKSTFGGKKMASDPLYNMAAQLVAAELNYAVPAFQCPPVTGAIADANVLLTKYAFNGTESPPHASLLASDATLANDLAKRLDDYNNNFASACQ